MNPTASTQVLPQGQPGAASAGVTAQLKDVLAAQARARTPHGFGFLQPEVTGSAAEKAAAQLRKDFLDKQARKQARENARNNPTVTAPPLAPNSSAAGQFANESLGLPPGMGGPVGGSELDLTPAEEADLQAKRLAADQAAAELKRLEAEEAAREEAARLELEKARNSELERLRLALAEATTALDIARGEVEPLKAELLTVKGNLDTAKGELETANGKLTEQSKAFEFLAPVVAKLTLKQKLTGPQKEWFDTLPEDARKGITDAIPSK